MLAASQTFNLHTHNLKLAARFFRATNNKVRQKILQVLHKKGKLTVTELYQHLKLEQSAASQHLAILRKARLVFTERRGKQVFYSVNYEQLKNLHAYARLLTGEN